MDMAVCKCVNLVGYIVPEKTNCEDEGSESEEEEKETVPEFLDLKEMNSVSSGGFKLRQSVPATREVDFMFNGKKVRVTGRFPLRNSWWEISCSAQQYRQKLVVIGYPSYKLRTGPENDWRALVALFLKECAVDSHFVTRFIQWLPEDRYVDLKNLEEVLQEFGESIEGNADEVNFIKSSISKSDAGFHARVAARYPYIMKYLPTLLPSKFLDFLLKEKTQEQSKNEDENLDSFPKNKPTLLARLEELIESGQVWKFGFGYVMYKEFQLVRCETKLKDLKSCDLFSKMSFEQQNALEVYNELKVYCSQDGHTYIELKVLEKRMSRGTKRKKMDEISVWKSLELLRELGVLIVQKEKIALRNLHKYEKDIAECLRQLIEGEAWKIDLDVRKVLRSAGCEMKSHKLATSLCSASEINGEDGESSGSKESELGVHESMDEESKDGSVSLDEDQVRAAEMICSNAVTVISGKGGCGKTTVVSMIFKAAMEQLKNQVDSESTSKGCEQKENDTHPVVLLTAPTGRATSLLTTKTCFTAYTMHQVLWSYMHTKKSESGQPLDWMFANVRVLVVDEGSLVSVQILSSLLSMLTKHAQLQKFIILGDVKQLPSIEPGNVLNDLFDSLKKVKWAIEMRTNHRAESKLIVENAGLIAKMGVEKSFLDLNYDAAVELGKTSTLPSLEKRFIRVLLPEKGNSYDLQDAIKNLLESPAPGLKDDASSQFVAFTRNECALINELCCKHYSGHTTKTHKNKVNFQIHDKVCCTRNGYVTDKDKEEAMQKNKDDNVDGSKKNVKERLCNGEIFFITQDLTVEDANKRIKSRSLTLDNRRNKQLTVDYRELMKECKLQHAWARTIHTFQGSEEKTIVYVLDDGIHQNWKHVYTAVTRGQSRVYIMAKTNGLKKAIRNHVIKRNTRLQGFVVDLLHNSGMIKKDFLSQSQFGTPKRSSGFQAPPSTQESSISPGPSRGFPAMMHLTEVTCQNLNNAASGFSGFSFPVPASPSPRK